MLCYLCSDNGILPSRMSLRCAVDNKPVTQMRVNSVYKCIPSYNYEKKRESRKHSVRKHNGIYLNRLYNVYNK